jgi:excisionase family DNA binding protein
LGALHPSDWAALVEALGPTMSRRGRRSRRSAADRPEELEHVVQLLLDWPNGFHAHLAGSLPSAQVRRKTVCGTYRRMHIAMSRKLAGGCFDFLRTAFDHFIDHSWPYPITRRSCYGATRSADRRSVTRASQDLGVTVRTLTRIAESIGVKLERVRTRSRRSEHHVSVIDLQRLKTASAAGLSVRQAAAALGLSRGRVSALVAGGVLEAIRSRRPVLIAGSSVNEALAVARRLAVDGPASSITTLSALLRRQLSMKDTCRFFKSVLSGQQRLIRLPTWSGRLGDLCVDPSCLDPVGKIAAVAMTVTEAAAKLGVKQEVAYALVRRGLLQSTSATGRRRSQAMISASDIAAFKRGFVSAAELAQMHRTSPRAVAHLLQSRNIKPIAGPGVDGCRQYFFSRDPRVAKLAALRHGGDLAGVHSRYR